MKIRQIQITIDVDTEVYEYGKMHEELTFVLQQACEKILGRIQPGFSDFAAQMVPLSRNYKEMLHNSEGGDTGTLVVRQKRT